MDKLRDKIKQSHDELAQTKIDLEKSQAVGEQQKKHL